MMALATLCSRALTAGKVLDRPLSAEARAILYAARLRGVLEIKGNYRAFEAPERFLTVYVELNNETPLALKSRDEPALTIRFLDGFRELCEAGLIMHHLYRDFSLTRAGFAAAAGTGRADAALLEPLLEEQGLSADDLNQSPRT